MTDHQRELLTSVSVASTEADRKRLRKAEYPEVEKIRTDNHRQRYDQRNASTKEKFRSCHFEETTVY